MAKKKRRKKTTFVTGVPLPTAPTARRRKKGGSTGGSIGGGLSPGPGTLPPAPLPFGLPEVQLPGDIVPRPTPLPPHRDFELLGPTPKVPGTPDEITVPPGAPGGGEGGKKIKIPSVIEPSGIDPFGGELGAILKDLITNPQKVELLPPGLRELLEGTLMKLMGGEGIPANVLALARNQVRSGLEFRERDLLRRQKDSLAGRGTLGQGIGEGSLRDIEDVITERLADAFTKIELENAAAAERARQFGVGGTLDLGKLNALGSQIDQQGILDAIRIATGRELGLGELDLGRDRLELERIVQEFLLNEGLLNNFFGLVGGGGKNDIDLKGLLDLIGFNEGGPGFEFPAF